MKILRPRDFNLDRWIQDHDLISVREVIRGMFPPDYPDAGAVQFFYYIGGVFGGTVTENGALARPNSFTFRKTYNCKRVTIWGCGGGCGGGAGFTRASGNAGGGGGGGGSSGIARLDFDGKDVPDVMIVNVGMGGPGGTPGVSTGQGGGGQVAQQTTFVAPNLNQILLTIVGSSGNAGGGAAGAGGAGGALGSTPAATLWSDMAIAKFLTAGTVGAAGSATTTGVSPSAGVNILMPGAGGAGVTAGDVTANGGSVPSSLGLPASAAGVGALGGGSDGGTGYFQDIRNVGAAFTMMFGGGGGGSGGTGPGGRGGNAAYGAGGGGGGAGTTGGNGGNGGSGLVLISAW